MLIFTSSRQLRKYYESQILDRSESKKLEKAISIFDFEERAIISQNLRRVSEIERVQFLSEAIRKSKNYGNLKIETSLSNLINYINYFISFFEELNYEKVTLEKLQKEDFYEDYQTHIFTLKNIFYEYKSILEQNNKTDTIFIPLNYQLDKNYIKSLTKIEFYIEGHLSKFQFELFREISEFRPVSLIFYPTPFNSRVQRMFKEKLNIQDRDEVSEDKKFYFKYDFEYKLSFKPQNEKFIEIVEKKSLLNSKNISKKLSILPFKNRISQIAFVKYKIYQFIEKENILPSDIAIITLDENINSLLKFFDKKYNLNFSLGFDLKKEPFYRIISAYFRVLNRKSIEEKQRKSRIDSFIINSKLDELKTYSEEFFTFFEKNWRRKIKASLFLEKIYNLLKVTETKPASFQAISDHFFNFFSNKEIAIETKILAQYFLKEFENIRVTDVKGGKVTVLGLLETRGVKFKKVIVLDFNESVFPKNSQKDLFINSEIKQKVGLPTYADREDLQKFYLYRLYQNSEEIFLTALDSSSDRISSIQYFFDNRVVENNLVDFEEFLLSILFKKHEQKKNWYSTFLKNQMTFNYDFKNSEISFSKLKTFNDCKVKFYFQYVLKINSEIDNSQETKDEHSIGSKIHAILHKNYKEFKQLNLKELLNLLNSEEYNLNSFQRRVWKNYFLNFAKMEENRINYKYVDSEVELKTKIDDIFLTGRIDRIEQNLENNKFFAIDYKTGNLSDSMKPDLKQLAFYILLLENNNFDVSIGDMSYLYLKSGKLINSQASKIEQEKLNLIDELKSINQNSEFNLVKTDKPFNTCNFCNYSTLCKE